MSANFQYVARHLNIWRSWMKNSVFAVVCFALTLMPMTAVPASAHHAELCKTLGMKHANKAQRVKVVKNCRVNHAHDRETVKR
jgi:hypothetical protein